MKRQPDLQLVVVTRHVVLVLVLVENIVLDVVRKVNEPGDSALRRILGDSGNAVWFLASLRKLEPSST